MRLVSSIASASSETWGDSSTSMAKSRDGACTGTALRTASRSTRRSNGFSKKPSAPYLLTAPEAVFPPLWTPEMKKNGTFSRLRISATSNPIRSGSKTSSTASAGLSLRARSSAVRPRLAVCTA